MAESVPSVQASTDGRLRVHLCLWPTHTHTHSAGRHGEVHPWGAVGVPSATARPCSVRVAVSTPAPARGPFAGCRVAVEAAPLPPAVPRPGPGVTLSRERSRGSSAASAGLRSVPTPWAGGGHGEPMDASRARLPDDSPAGATVASRARCPAGVVIGNEVGPAGESSGAWEMPAREVT